MTLRGRLTTAFLAVVLGPVLLGSLFVGMTVATVSRDRTVERLDHAATTVRTGIGAVCRQLQAIADAVAVLPASGRRAAADQLVARGLASAILVTDGAEPGFQAGSTGSAGGAATKIGSTGTESGDTGLGWRDCGAPTDSGVTAIAATSQVASPAAGTGKEEAGGTKPGASAAAGGGSAGKISGNPVGGVTVSAAQSLDTAFVARLADSSGAEVTLLSRDGAGADSAQSTAASKVRSGVAELAATLPQAGEVQRTHNGDRYVRRIAAGPGQPLPLAVSVPRADPTSLYAFLLAAVLVVAAAAVLVARRLARSTTRPLAELSWAAGRVADGELDTRVPVRRNDEVGRLTATFNRMTRELQGYVQALTASRDQLRGHLAILGDTLSSTHDLHRILQVILQTALSATGARAGVVLLIDPADNTLVARCAEGLTGSWDVPEAELTALRIPLGEGVLGAVAATGEPRRGLNPDGEPACQTYVAVPICAPATVGDPLVPDETPSSTTPAPATLGVLALYDRLGLDEFDDSDLLTLRTFAGHAGVAVHNVRVHEEAQRLSLTDPLTGLWNYRYLRESLRREVERASRFGRMLTVLVLDLDHFKEVNDTYGHAAGDAVLAEFARRIRVGLREVDVAFRQGGEEFVVLLPETDAYGGAIVAERLGAATRDIPVPIDARRVDTAGKLVDRIPITVSIGIAVYPEHGGTVQQVLDAADDALYAAKGAGRDTYRLAKPPLEVTRSAVSPGVHDGNEDPAASTPGGPQPPRQSRGR
ncbi:MAG TPA: diguanylate cyclase [Actinoplanes sp.]|nr:diguanylate cyclase [Actinoplanes sp.]